MRVYTKIVFDIETLETTREESYQYSGPAALCKGGSDGGDSSYDKQYNKRMAKIAEQQQDMAEEYFNFWRTDQQPLEREQIQANRDLLPQQVALQKEQMTAESEMLGVRNDHEKRMIQYAQDDLAARQPLARKFYEQAMTGDDPTRAASEARAGVAQEMDAAKASVRRDAARMGVNVNSARFQRNQGDRSLDRARATAGAMSTARRDVKDRNFERLRTGMTQNLGVGG